MCFYNGTHKIRSHRVNCINRANLSDISLFPERIFVCFTVFILLFVISQDIQTDAPFHLLRLKVEVENNKLMVVLQECQVEVMRENRHLANMGSERLIREHRVRALRNPCYLWFLVSQVTTVPCRSIHPP